MYSVEEVAERLGLHVRTVRGYIRDGRLKAVRIGKQYRIARADLEAVTGTPAPARTALEVTSIVEATGVDRQLFDRLSTLLLTSVSDPGDAAAPPLRVQTVYDGERGQAKIVIIGAPAQTAGLLGLIDALLTAEQVRHG
ncbi:helix-turn-helix domain-containing protein [Nonomuraea longicatena]